MIASKAINNGFHSALRSKGPTLTQSPSFGFHNALHSLGRRDKRAIFNLAQRASARMFSSQAKQKSRQYIKAHS